MVSIERVHVVFKTHLDIGFTNLAAHVTKQYVEEYIPKAIELAERMESEGGKERFIWTTGSWLIRHYLDNASEEGKRVMEQAISRGHIAWHGFPFTTHTELMDPLLIRYGLSISRELDKRFGKRTIAAKMTDVPGHTLGMVPFLSDAGIQYMHLGVNPASMRPDVPRLFRWQSDDGSEIIVNYAGSYGEAVQVEGLEDVLVFAHSGDNCGPPDADEIRKQFAEIQSRYPEAEVLASTLDAFAEKLAERRDSLPLIREEIGDTWIHGAGTDPLKLAKLRELQRLRSGWIEDGTMIENSEEYKGMSEGMLFVAEHTWGLDVKKWLPDFRNYSKKDFQAARLKDEVDVHDLPAKFGYIGAFAMDEFDRHSQGLFEAEQSRRSYSMIESSWAEQREYIDQAVSHLAPVRREEALQALNQLSPVSADLAGAETLQVRTIHRSGPYSIAFSENGALIHLEDDNGKRWIDEKTPFGSYAYETFGTEDYARYFRTYMQNLPVTHPWADADFSKPGFEFVRPRPSHMLFQPVLIDLHRLRGESSDRYVLRLRMPEEAHKQYGAPRELEIEYAIDFVTGIIGISLLWFGKEANRLPEASWFGCGLQVDNPNLWTMDKLGMPLSPLRVVKDGNRNLHALGSGVRYEGADGVADIETLDAALAAPGRGRLLQFDNTFAPLDGGWDFNLHNNIWGTNFPMWYGEDAKFRFRLRLHSNRK
ncbi:DUF5054 domain-containing protein [Cohnella lupini]|uniref:Glycosyl hydrolase family 38 n=1 Tax=Cohnella lupini TaxID=1294267 RepID=A0A3D9IEX7_9BACL|nr:DUF5054 domain-containing protein [Cohnella lupini]RED60343.1 glycosyl hydrolase family 38 [Cohnella lupini]